MSRLSFGGKCANETRKETFDFISRLATGETISSASVTATTYSGTDAVPSGLISGAAAISGTKVTQSLTGGIEGVTYLLICSAVTSTGQTLKLPAYLVVTPASEG